MASAELTVLAIVLRTNPMRIRIVAREAETALFGMGKSGIPNKVKNLRRQISVLRQLKADKHEEYQRLVKSIDARISGLDDQIDSLHTQWKGK